MTEASDYTSLIAHAHDLQEKSERWHRSLATAFLNEEEQAEFARFVDWLYSSEDGDLDDFGGEELRSRLSCPSEDCWGRSCRYADKCFVAKARARALQAHVVITNHALVLADAASSGTGLLPSYRKGLYFPYMRQLFQLSFPLFDLTTLYFVIVYPRCINS